MGSNPTGGHGSLSFVIVMCCHAEVSATSLSLVQRSPTDCGASLCVIKKPQNEEAMARVGPQRHKKMESLGYPERVRSGYMDVSGWLYV